MRAPRAPWAGVAGSATGRTWDLYTVDVASDDDGWVAYYGAGASRFPMFGGEPIEDRDEAMIVCELHALQMSLGRIAAMNTELEREQERIVMLMGLPY